MSPINDTKVLIGGNVYTLSGDESEEYIQRVALYINNKLNDIKATDNAKKLNTRLLSVLLEINIADDYFKEKEKNDNLQHLIEEKDNKIAALEKELFDLNNKMQELIKRHENEMDKSSNQIDFLKEEVEHYKNELNEYIEVFDEKIK